MNCHRNQQQIGQNNHLQTLFKNHFFFLSNCKWFRWIVIKIRSKLVKTITSKHYLTLIPMFCIIEKSKSNHLQALYHTLQAKPSQKCKRVWERKKDGLALCSHFSGSGQLCVSFLVAVKILMKLYPPKNSFDDNS